MYKIILINDTFIFLGYYFKYIISPYKLKKNKNHLKKILIKNFIFFNKTDYISFILFI